MRYLVLGSAGQIGAPLVKYLKNEGHQVEEYDFRTNPLEDLRYLHLKKYKRIFVEKIEKSA